jgi:ubiquinone/menaquinone biosynthesis C-methylase UbiE
MHAWLIALLLSASSAFAGPPPYETRAEHDPDGIGKFYLGREIAHVMGPGGAPWLERPERETEERPQLVIDALEIKPGQTIADLGAGSGYYTFRIAPLVGEQGRVLAIDVEPRMLRIISDRAKRAGTANVTTVLSTPSDPNLEPNSVDLLFMVDVYHELEFPFEMLTRVREALKPGGRVALIEYRAEDPAVMIKPVHKMSERQIIRELTAAGFRHQKTVRTLPLQHLVLFQK